MLATEMSLEEADQWLKTYQASIQHKKAVLERQDEPSVVNHWTVKLNSLASLLRSKVQEAIKIEWQGGCLEHQRAIISRKIPNG